jgi:hypothetical protein
MSTLHDLKKSLKDQADVAEALGELTEFTTMVVTATALGGGLLTFPMVVAKSAKTAKAMLKLIKILLPSKNAKDFDFDPAERVDQIFYVLAQRSYLLAICDLKCQLSLPNKIDSKAHKKLIERISGAIVRPNRAEACFEFGWNPDSGPLQLFDAYNNWLFPLLKAMGAKEEETHTCLDMIEKKARQILHKELISRKSGHQWLVNYQLLNTNAHIIDLLRDYTSPEIIPTDEAWKTYLKDLSKRPSNPIWGEEKGGLGIDKLFVEPDYTYIRTIPANRGILTPGTPLCKLLAGLLSWRRPSTELVFLMGGPGSGKTSVMEILCSSLAKTKRKSIMSQAQAYLESIGHRAVAQMLSSSPDCVLAIDGFDELAHATLSTLETFFRNAQDLAKERSGYGLRLLLSGRPTLFSSYDVAFPSGSHVLSLQPFDESKIRLWSKNWRSATKGSFRGECYLSSQNKDIRELPTQPMLLYLLARMHEDGHAVPVDLKNTGGARYQVYSRILSWVCRRQKEKSVSTISDKHLRRFLQIAGLATQQSATRTLHWDSFSRALGRAGLAENTAEIDSRAYSTILSFAFTSLKDRAWEFTHKSFGYRRGTVENVTGTISRSFH